MSRAQAETTAGKVSSTQHRRRNHVSGNHLRPRRGVLRPRQQATNALIDFNLRVAAGETVALLGPSGSGKSTALNALAGFVRPTSGSVRLGGRDVTDLPPAKRGIGVVLQSYALFPHMRVADNVAFGLQGAPRRTRARSARASPRRWTWSACPAYGKRLPA